MAIVDIQFSHLGEKIALCYRLFMRNSGGIKRKKITSDMH